MRSLESEKLAQRGVRCFNQEQAILSFFLKSCQAVCLAILPILLAALINLIFSNDPWREWGKDHRYLGSRAVLWKKSQILPEFSSQSMVCGLQHGHQMNAC